MFDLEKAKQRAFDRCNLAGESVDIYAILYQYKAIRNLGPDEIDEIYEDFSNRLFGSTY